MIKWYWIVLMIFWYWRSKNWTVHHGTKRWIWGDNFGGTNNHGISHGYALATIGNRNGAVMGLELFGCAESMIFCIFPFFQWQIQCLGNRLRESRYFFEPLNHIQGFGLVKYPWIGGVKQKLEGKSSYNMGHQLTCVGNLYVYICVFFLYCM